MAGAAPVSSANRLSITSPPVSTRHALGASPVALRAPYDAPSVNSLSIVIPVSRGSPVLNIAARSRDAADI